MEDYILRKHLMKTVCDSSQIIQLKAKRNHLITESDVK